MTELYIKSTGLGKKGVSVVSVRNGRTAPQMFAKAFVDVMPTRNGGIPLGEELVEGKYCNHIRRYSPTMCELYAVAWGLTMAKDTKVKLFTLSFAVSEWLKDGWAPEDYADVWQFVENARKGHNVQVVHVPYGADRNFNRLTDKMLELCNTIGI